MNDNIPGTLAEHLLLLGRMDAKIDVLLLQGSRHDERISRLEAFKNKSVGIVLAVSALAGAAGSYVPVLLKNLTHP